MSNVAAGKDTDDEGESLNNVEKVLTKLNIKLRESTGEWRSFEDVLDEVAKKWKDFSDVEQSQISTAIAGTRQQETFRALMNNYDQVGRLANIAADSTGSASKRMETYLESVEAKTNQLKTVWEEFIMNLNQSDSYKEFLDACIWMIENMPIVLGHLTSLLGIVVAFKAQNILTGLSNIKNSILDLGGNLKTMSSVISGNTIVIQKNTEAKIQEYLINEKMNLGLKKIHIARALEKQGISEEIAMEKADIIAKKGEMSANDGLITSNQALTFSFQAVTLAITAVVAIATLLVQWQQQIEQDNLNMVSSTQNAVDSLKDEENKLKSITERYKEINDSVGTALDKKDKLTTLQNELNEAYEGEYGAINLVNGAYDEQIEKLEKITGLKENEQLTTLQQGQSARKDLLDDWTKNHLGAKSQYSDDVINRVATIANKNNSTLGTTAVGGLVLDSNGKNVVHIYEELVKLQKEYNSLGLTEKASQVGNMIGVANQGFIIGNSSLKDDYEKYKEAAKQEDAYELLQFKLNNKEKYEEYEKFLSDRKELKEKFDKATSQAEKDEITKEYEELDGKGQQLWNNLYINGTGVSKDLRRIMDEAFGGDAGGLNAIGYSDFIGNTKNSAVTFDQLGKSSIEVAADLKKVEKEIASTGEISEESQSKIYELYKLINENEDLSGSILPSFLNYLEQIGIEVPKTMKKISAISSLSNLKNNNSQSESDIAILKGEYNSSKVTIDSKGSSTKILESDALEAMKSGKQSFTSRFMGAPVEFILVDGKWQQKSTGETYTTIDNIQTRYNTEKQAKLNLQNKKQEQVNNILDTIGDAELQKEISEKLKDKISDFVENVDTETTLDSIIEAVVGLIEKADIKKEDFQAAAKKQEYGLGYTDKTEGYGVGSESGFNTYRKDISTVQKQIDSLNDGEYVDPKDLKELSIMSSDVREEIIRDGKITAEELQNYLDDVKENLDENLDKIDELSDEISGDLVNAIKEVDDSDVFDSFASAVENATDTIHDLTEETGKLTAYSDDLGNSWDFVDMDLTNLDEMQKKLDEIRDSTNGAIEASKNYGVEIDDSNIKMAANMTAMTDLKTEAENLANALAGQGEEGDGNVNLANAWNTLGLSEIFATDEMGRFNGMSVDINNKTAFLEALMGDWENLDADQQSALNSLIAYLIQYGNLSDEQRGVLEKALVVTGGASNNVHQAVKYQTNLRRTGNTTSPKSSGSGSKNSYSAEDAAEDLKSILNDIEKYEADIEVDLEDQTEELLNHYNLERNKLDLIKEELDYYDDIYDVTEDTSKWLETQLKVLDEESKKAKEIINANDKIEKQRQKVYADNAQYNVSSWFDEAGNETLAYGDLLNSFEYRMEAIQRETAAAMRAEYNLVAGSTDKDAISDAKKRIKNIEEEGANRVKVLEKEKEKVENIYDSVSKLNDAWKENQENIRDSLKEMNDRVKSIRDELIDDIMEQLERAVDKMNKSIEKDVTRLEQLKQVQESYNDILNTTIDTQQELDDELRANMDTYQYLDETMRQLMFNEDDYKELSKVLEGIQSDIAEIWEDHYNQIQDLTDDEMYKAEYITQETERQLAMKQKEYDIAKAELDVAKAQTNLQNVLNERNTRILGTDGQWSWVANPDAVKDARQQLADAEREKTRLEREKEQQALINVMDKMIDSDNLQIDKNNELLERIQEAIERETEEVKSVEEALMNAEGANLPELTATLVGALGSDGGYMKELLGDINHSQKELAAALRGQTVAQAIAQLKSGTMSKSEFDELTSRLGYYFDETTGEIVTQDGRFKASYKGFTIKNNNDIQLQTAANGVQVTGNGGQQQSSSTTDIASAEARASEEELMQIAREVWLGQWGNGQDRRNRLTAAGYDYEAVQALVNRGRSYFFDQGGIASNIGLLAKDTMKPERVLSPRQTKAFENLVSNLTSNPILSALSRVPSVSSNFNELETSQDYSKKYYFSNFTVQANDIKEFIDSIETMMPMKK